MKHLKKKKKAHSAALPEALKKLGRAGLQSLATPSLAADALNPIAGLAASGAASMVSEVVNPSSSPATGGIGSLLGVFAGAIGITPPQGLQQEQSLRNGTKEIKLIVSGGDLIALLKREALHSLFSNG